MAEEHRLVWGMTKPTSWTTTKLGTLAFNRQQHQYRHNTKTKDGDATGRIFTFSSVHHCRYTPPLYSTTCYPPPAETAKKSSFTPCPAMASTLLEGKSANASESRCVFILHSTYAWCGSAAMRFLLRDSKLTGWTRQQLAPDDAYLSCEYFWSICRKTRLMFE
jgi:hypothetical protein